MIPLEIVRTIPMIAAQSRTDSVTTLFACLVIWHNPPPHRRAPKEPAGGRRWMEDQRLYARCIQSTRIFLLAVAYLVAYVSYITSVEMPDVAVATSMPLT